MTTWDLRRPSPLTRSRPLRAVAITALGCILVVIAARNSDIETPAALQISALAGAVAFGSTLVGTAVLFAARRRSIGTQAGLLAVTSVVGVGIAGWVSARAMFLSNHDFSVLLLVLLTAGIASCLGALALGNRMDSSARSLVQAARQLDVSGEPIDITRDQPTEMNQLADELHATAQRLRDSQAQTEAVDASRRSLIAWVAGDLQSLTAKIDRCVRSPHSDDDLEAHLQSLRQLVKDLAELNGVEGESVQGRDRSDDLSTNA